MLKRHDLKYTRPRRLVLRALASLKKPCSPYDVQKWIHAKNEAVHVVTIYRVLETFVRIGIVHRHPCDGHFFLCSLPAQPGHHRFLHCTSCGEVREYLNEALCQAEEQCIRSSHFRVHTHVSEFLGTCAACAA
ncbi:MAG: Fur family transcriptional regulator [Candidatus Peribacteraceae bacterium]|nr:Fur family transcriptional regulator [Candidatus Peribacteraceae bacterium]